MRVYDQSIFSLDVVQTVSRSCVLDNLLFIAILLNYVMLCKSRWSPWAVARKLAPNRTVDWAGNSEDWLDLDKIVHIYCSILDCNIRASPAVRREFFLQDRRTSWCSSLRSASWNSLQDRRTSWCTSLHRYLDENNFLSCQLTSLLWQRVARLLK